MTQPFYVYKALRRGMVPVAHLVVTNTGVRLETRERAIERALELAFRKPALLSSWSGNELVKKKPVTVEERVVALLKRYFPRPYFASRDAPESFDPIYTKFVEVSE